LKLKCDDCFQTLLSIFNLRPSGEAEDVRSDDEGEEEEEAAAEEEETPPSTPRPLRPPSC